jgi:hypothetical protein
LIRAASRSKGLPGQVVEPGRPEGEAARTLALCDPGQMASEGGAEGAGQESVILASFENRYAAEHMLLSVGRGFRKQARKGGATAFVVSENKDGSLKLTESRVLEANDLTTMLLHLSVSWMIGFLGLLSTLKGLKATAHAAHEKESHVGSNEQRAHEIIAEAGPTGAIALVRCKEADIGRAVAAQAADRGRRCWHGSRAQFLADLDPGSTDDWVRSALDEPSGSSD